jgi:miniconductance mechanosensitive channel
MKRALIDWIKSFYVHLTKGGEVFDEVSYNQDIFYWTIGLFAALVVASVLIWVVSRLILLEIMHKVAIRSKTEWDDYLMKNKVFKGLAMVVPLIFMEYFLSIVFFHYTDVLNYTHKIVAVMIVLVSIVIVNRFFNGVGDIIMSHKAYRDKPIKSYVQVMKIIFTGILIIAILSILTNKSPLFFLTSLGAVSAILLLVFRDTILGFVGSIQLASNDMIRIGDWVTMEKYGADGDVTEINLTTVKVRNFDNTITTIPTYSFISDSFRNWRGMQESDGRRVKRAIHISMDSVGFASQELIAKLKKVGILSDFIERRQKEINDYNRSHGLTDEGMLNKRRQTNLGLFRRYIEYYLKNNTHINSEMTLMVRQLTPTEKGVPLEVYCFTHTKEWEQYEIIIADIFDHLFAIVKEFELVGFEEPTGNDLRSLKG